jgi:PiT family inorganic phosphate transporter/sulfate permease
MDPLVVLAVVVCFGLALNIGGNNTAAEMAPAYGAGVRTKKEALVLAAVFSMLGALLASDQVVHTVATGIVNARFLEGNATAALVVLFSAVLVIAFANILKLPIATTHATIGAMVGFGLHSSSVHWSKVFSMVIWWLGSPILALLVSYVLGRLLIKVKKGACSFWTVDKPPQNRIVIRIFLTASGCYLAFTAGANGLAKAIGPLVGTGVISNDSAVLLGAVGLAIGAVTIGSGVLETVGRHITHVSGSIAVLTELITGTILLAASAYGIPISVAEIVTASLVGFSGAHSSILSTWHNEHVGRIFKLWFACPFLSAGISYVGTCVFVLGK